MEFTKMSIERFNKVFNLNIRKKCCLEGDYYQYFNEELEKSDLMYMSTSLCENDIVEDMKEECERLNLKTEDYHKTGLELIEVDGIYLAINNLL